MSTIVSIDNISINKLKSDLTIVQNPDTPAQKYFSTFDVDTEGKKYNVPFSYGQSILKKSDILPHNPIPHNIILRDQQVEIASEIINTFNSGALRSVILELPCGYGKTIIALFIAASLGGKTLIIVNRKLLIDQWQITINHFFSDAGENFVVRMPRAAQTEENVNLLIVDECHQLMSEKNSVSVRKITPQYLIGLSATPYRPDHMNRLMALYFGSKNISRAFEEKYIVYKVNSRCPIPISKSASGRVDWNLILKTQSEIPARNDLIARIVKKFSDRCFIILVKRIEHANLLRDLLREEKVSVLTGATQNYDEDSRVIIGTVSKIGTGFNFTRANALILAADVQEYFIQYLGRIFRVPDCTPIVFDIVDQNFILNKHYNVRKQLYLKNGAEIKPLEI